MLWLILALLALAAAAATIIGYRMAFYAPEPHYKDIYELPPGSQYEAEKEWMHSLIRAMDAVPFEPVTITAWDGTPLFGRYYHVADGAPLQLQFHGFRSVGIQDFCGGNVLAREAGQNTLIVDQRSHGKSGGTAITFGIREQYDCLDWIRWANDRFGADTPIFLSGVSMGAATVLMAAGLPDLPANVRGVIADSPYSCPREIIRFVCGRMHLPPALICPFVFLGARLIDGFDLSAGSPKEAVKQAKVPILIIHGEDDRMVPCDMSREIAENCASPVRRETFPDAGHGLSYILDKDRYARATAEFFEFCRSGSTEQEEQV
ncbi:MAG: alpha/beta hydrolase [Oscillibacter sp.]|nr:alpha/beta hydrolase [Oscillibacter sp.]